MNALHPLTFLTWFLWGLFMGIGWCTACALWAGAKALLAKVQWPAWDADRNVPRQRWEYMSAPHSQVNEFNTWGSDGWELAGVMGEILWFKRAIA